MFDAGRICLRGDTPDEQHFVNRHGRFVARLRPPPESIPA
jgi:hypothetical protein